MDIQTIVTMVFGSVIRQGLAVVGVWLASHGVAADASTAFVSNGFDFVIGVLVVAVSLILSFVSKKLALDKMPIRK